MFCLKFLKPDNESGMALLVALLVTVIGTILAGSYMTVVISEYKGSVGYKHRAQSLFLAEAGIQKAIYYINNPDELENPLAMYIDYDNGERSAEYPDPPTLTEYDIDDPDTPTTEQYKISLFDRFDEELNRPDLPAGTFLVRSVGIIPRQNQTDIEHKVSCIVSRLEGLPIPAALGIMDSADAADELDKFESAAWTISGEDMDGPGGLPGIAVANTGDDLPTQLGTRIDQVTGWSDLVGVVTGEDAISEDTSLPQSLNDYVDYFRRIAINISGMGSIPSSLLGTEDEYQILYADLSQGPIKLSGTDKGSGVLVLEGDGVFEMTGGSEWNGVVICAGESNILLKGGGGPTKSHIYGALLIADGTVEMNGNADIVYSSSRMATVNEQLVLYQVYSWSGGWGGAL